MKELNKKIKQTIENIQYIYKNVDRPFVVGYSGGKDSTCTLQLVWHAIAKLPKNERTKKIFVISSDTLIETPAITNYIAQMIKAISQSAKKQNMPVSACCVYPITNNTFWVNLLGRGYPAPRTRFRWCTERLKIEPANRFISDLVSQHGEAIMVLGARKDESAVRAQVIAATQSADNTTAGALLPRHSSLPNCYVFSPIADWTTSEVWEYLLHNSDTPWNTSNRDLAAIYKNSTAGECPLVVDKNTPSCGNSRFGCWVCTVVDENKSLENMVDNGETWLAPLLVYRSMLMETTDPDKKAKYRSYKRRTGQVHFQKRKNDDDTELKIIRGPYKFEWRQKFLLELFKTQEELNKNYKDNKIQLISEEELKAIRKIWITEENDWQDSVPKIYKEITGKELDWGIDDSASFGIGELEVLDEICREHDIPVDLVAQLLDKEKEFNALGRRSTLTKELESILKKEWRSESEVMEVTQRS